MSELRLYPLGGMGQVTQNMYIYQYERELLIVDCGIGFPDIYMPGIDTLLPDVSHLHKLLADGNKIVGMCISHGHEDHFGALAYVLPELPSFPIWASPLTAGFAQKRLQEKGLAIQINLFEDKHPVQFGKFFSVFSVAVTHSVPDTKHLVIDTPEGVVYHGSDFKLDPNPVDGKLTDLRTIAEIGERGVFLALVDCLRIEREEWVKSESLVGPVLEEEMASTQGKFIITLMSSHIHRIQQIVDSAEKLHRKVVFVGRSVEQNVDVASALGLLHLPDGIRVNKRKIANIADESLCIVIAGSQGQEGSSLVRAVYGEHSQLQIGPNDKVVFSADAIPGNEIPYFKAIDELSRNGVKVIYPTINPDIHQSGHASAPEQHELLTLLQPRFAMPIGGADRHRVKFKEMVEQSHNISAAEVLLPKSGEVLGFQGGKVRSVAQLALTPRTVDGLGIGDVGPIVLSDRMSLSQAGIVVVVIPRFGAEYDLKNTMVVSRGFVFMKHADEVVDFIKKQTAQIVAEQGEKAKVDDVKRAIEKQLAKRLYEVIQREPLIVPVVLEM